MSQGAGLEFKVAATDYSRRNLTRESDALNAFKGALEAFRNPTGKVNPMGNYFGIPLYSSSESSHSEVFLYGLAWSIADHELDDLLGLHSPRTIYAIKPGLIKRRRGVPSWTWVGWQLSKPFKLRFGSWTSAELLSNTRLLSLRGIGRLISCVRMHVKSKDLSKTLDWQEDNDCIMELYSRDQMSSGLGFEGWVFKIRIPVRTLETEPKDAYGISDAYGPLRLGPLTTAHRDLSTCYFISKHLHYDLLEGEDNAVEFRFLLLGLWDPYGRVASMVIAKRSSDAPYERVGLISFYFGGLLPRMWDEKLRCPGPDFPQCSKESIWLA
jgi:hypothetical protein